MELSKSFFKYGTFKTGLSKNRVFETRLLKNGVLRTIFSLKYSF
jgi:hypothetical protein